MNTCLFTGFDHPGIWGTPIAFYATARYSFSLKGKKDMTADNRVSDESIEAIYIIMARIVRDHGDKYLPLFRRIHEERELRKANRDLQHIALQVARNRL